MRAMLIVTLGSAVVATAVPAQAQVVSGGTTTVRSGGNWQGGGVRNRGNSGTWNPGVRNGGNPGTWSPAPRQGTQVGGDPRTWGPRNQPARQFGGDPRTWGPGNQPARNWNGGAWNGQQWGGGRWGGQLNGRWYAGGRAPGGWNAYRRPQRGWVMPGYWLSPAWAINDWQFYGLQAPPQGYGWSRYYDDAVLLDQRGYVYDSVGGLDWSRADQPYATGYGYPSQGYWNAPGEGIDPRCYERGRGSGIGGALVGGAIGAGIGAATGGLGTALIGGGVGALAGQAIDRDSRRDDIVCDTGGYPAGYGDGAPGRAYVDDGYAHGQGGAGYAPPPAYGYQGYGYIPGATATATVEFGAPVTTTTTTTTVTEEWVTERRVARRAVRPKTKVVCRC